MGSVERVLVLGIVVVIVAILGIAVWGASDGEAGALDTASDGGVVVQAPVLEPGALPSGITPPSEVPAASTLTEIEKLKALRDQRQQELAAGQPVQPVQVQGPGAAPLTDGGSGVASGVQPEGGVPLNHVAPVDAGAAPAGTGAPVTLDAPKPVEPAAVETIYTVVAGDSLWKIAHRQYGGGDVQKSIDAIYAANPTLGVGEALKIGQKLKLPAGIAKDPARLSAPEQADATGGRTYVVKEGDTLSTIAKRELGSTKLWTEIYELNRTRISDPARIKVGMKLTLPPKN
jgi:nucleoid-associated protein YgaU